MPSDLDDEGLRPDWRDAEFGGPYPDTLELKVLVTTVRNRVEQVRDLIRAPRRERSRDEHHRLPADTSSSADTSASTPTDTSTSTPIDTGDDVQLADPDEPPF